MTFAGSAAAFPSMLERLQKIIARAGVASRRQAEQLILAGEVTVNGRVIMALGAKADAEQDHIRVAGKLLRFPKTKTYLVLHKPPGCVATLNDPEGRTTLRDFLYGVRARVFPVGRLEYDASGLLLLTDDGELASEVLKASQRGALRQTFWVKVRRRLSEEERRQVEEKVGSPLRLLQSAPNPWYEVTLAEARRDRLRRALVKLGHPVEKIKRVKLADLELGNLPPGRYRHLSPEEVRALRQAVEKAARETARRAS